MNFILREKHIWNVNYDEFLIEDISEKTFLVGYTDDIAAVIMARNTKGPQLKLRRVMLTTKT